MIWHACDGPRHIKPIAGTVYRLVESQEQTATLGYVDTLDEQDVLEELLDASKPPYPEASHRLHYLLKTPFRYPPLPWGSRFGRVHEPGLFYGGKSEAVTLAESAYYRLVFLFSMEGPPPKSVLNSEHSLFCVGYATDQGIQLQEPPFSDHAAALSDPVSYDVCQNLGGEMRNAGVLGFEYKSARDPGQGICVALYTPEPFTQEAPSSMNQWLCQTSEKGVMLKQAGPKSRPVFFPTESFLVNGNLPMPA